jgi:aldose 1-epimerase
VKPNVHNGTFRSFGRLPDGQEVDVYTLGSKDGLQAEILTLGGTLRSLTFPVKGKRIPLHLSLPDLPAYLKDTSYIGQLVGRYGNRIAGGKFKLDGKEYKLTANNGGNTLHGGDVGFGKYVWKVEMATADKTALWLSHDSPAGTNGFPGNLRVTAMITVSDNTLYLQYGARTDAPTPINLTWHPYFTLSGNPQDTTDDQRLQIAASHYLPVNAARVPTGEIAPVDGTPFDFRKSREMRVPPPSSHPQIALTRGYDHCWVLDKPTRIAAELYAPSSRVLMEVKTDMPGLQVYDAAHFRTVYPKWHAIAIEPENFPDAPNHPNFPSSILRPGVKYEAYMSFAFGEWEQ